MRGIIITIILFQCTQIIDRSISDSFPSEQTLPLPHYKFGWLQEVDPCSMQLCPHLKRNDFFSAWPVAREFVCSFWFRRSVLIISILDNIPKTSREGTGQFSPVVSFIVLIDPLYFSDLWLMGPCRVYLLMYSGISSKPSDIGWVLLHCLWQNQILKKFKNFICFKIVLNLLYSFAQPSLKVKHWFRMYVL